MKRKWGKWESIMLLAALAPLALLVANPFGGLAESWRWNPFVRNGAVSRATGCQGHLAVLGNAIQQYRRDYDGKFPLAYVGGGGLFTPASGAYGWADALIPYSSNCDTCNICPAEETPLTKREAASGFADYWFNENLSGREGSKIKNVTSLFVVGDGGGGDITNAAYSRTSIPPAWLTTPNSPARRHLGGANYVFADSHGRWIAAENFKNYTFTPR